jgi:WD40 repeat protein
MTKIDLDWTFDHIPAEDEIEPPPLPPPPEPRPDKEHRRRWRLPLALLTLVAIAGLGVYGFSWFGWQRLRSQIAAEIAYEDERSFARDAQMVAALQSKTSEAWVRQRADEAGAGLPSPLPAANLRPLPEPGEVLRLTTPAPDTFEVTVLRTFVDSAGERYQFEFTQRYRNLGPGLWERLPPDESRLRDTSTWNGRRLTATYPVLDAPWMEQALPQIDAYLVALCEEWDCPFRPPIMVTFSGRLSDLPSPPEDWRAADAAPTHPIIFDLPSRPSQYPSRAVLPSPQLAGYPHDEAAAAALIRATAVHLLGYLAEELFPPRRIGENYFFDALLARAEVRLGISAPPTVEITPYEFAPPAQLWQDNRASPRSDLPFRLQALSFLDFALAAQPASAELRLLRNLRRQSNLDDWLAASLDVEAAPLVEAWVASVTAGFASSATPWERLDGLAYACEGSAGLVREGRLHTLPLAGGSLWLSPHGLSPDGTRLAVVAPGVQFESQLQLQILDLNGSDVQLVSEGGFWPLGWSASGQLVYLSQGGEAGEETCGDFPCRLRAYDPATGRDYDVIRQPVSPSLGIFLGGLSLWSPDRSALGLTLTDDSPEGESRAVPAIVSLIDPVQALIPAREGHSPVLSPDGTRVAVIVGGAIWDSNPPSRTSLEVVDLETQATTTLLTSEALAAEGQPELILGAEWSPDGAVLAVLTSGEQNSLLLLPTDGNPPRTLATSTDSFPIPLGFSADSRYLAALNMSGDRGGLRLYDLHTDGGEIFIAAAWGYEFFSKFAAWSPTGHLLAVAGPGGLYVTDPATGEFYWINSHRACRLAWYDLP